MKPTTGTYLRINLPHWADRPEVQNILNGMRAATWHAKGYPISEYSDWFTVYQDGETFDLLPNDLMDEINTICKENNFDEGLIWISFLKDEI